MDTLRFGVEWSCRLDEFFTEQIPQYWNGIKEAVKESAKTAMQKLIKLKDIILELCREHEIVLRSLLVKVGTKALIKYGAQMAVKGTARVGVKQGMKAALKTGAKAGLKGAIHPIGMVADGAQAGLELLGYEEAGKKVGVLGNAAGGAVAGFAVAGPVGAGIGAATGTAVWFVGEVAGKLFQP